MAEAPAENIQKISPKKTKASIEEPLPELSIQQAAEFLADLPELTATRETSQPKSAKDVTIAGSSHVSAVDMAEGPAEDIQKIYPEKTEASFNEPLPELSPEEAAEFLAGLPELMATRKTSQPKSAKDVAIAGSSYVSEVDMAKRPAEDIQEISPMKTEASLNEPIPERSFEVAAEIVAELPKGTAMRRKSQQESAEDVSMAGSSYFSADDMAEGPAEDIQEITPTKTKPFLNEPIPEMSFEVDAENVAEDPKVTGTRRKLQPESAEDVAIAGSSDRRSSVYVDVERIEELPSEGAKSLESRSRSGGRGRGRFFSCCERVYDWFPNMCSCVENEGTNGGNRSRGRGRTYERLSSGPSIFEFSNFIQRLRRRDNDEYDNEKQEELRFYNEDMSYQTVVVEKNLCASDLCQLLTLKNRAANDSAWSIVESWPELGIERTLEDHEDVLSVHRDMLPFAPHYDRQFIFRKDYLKFEFFVNPRQFFPADMVDFENCEFSGGLVDVYTSLQIVLSQGGECPNVSSQVWMRLSEKGSWTHAYILLQARKLYLTPKPSGSSAKRPMTLTGTSAKRPTTATGAVPKRPTIDTEKLQVLAHLTDYHVYAVPNPKKSFGAPFEWALCLRPSSSAEAEQTEVGETGLKVLTFDSEKARSCWYTAMRLAKYGKQLRENYRAFKNKQCEANVSPKDYSSYTVPNESVRSRVAMDFTGSVGKIVEDPQEARAIAATEGTVWKRSWRPPIRTTPGSGIVKLHGLEAGIHTTQPWFHGGMSRQDAGLLVTKHGSVDGVFLVRDSRRHLGAFVLTYKYGGKVIHLHILPVLDQTRNAYCYSLDDGATKFYDLLQLVEFYQLNTGTLQTRLSHFVVQSSSKITKPSDF